MKADITTLDAKKSGTVELSDEVFGLVPRADILHRVVTWQLNKRRAGTHNVKTRSEIRGSGAKIWAQKGTGRARHSDKKAPIFRGGGKAFGPVVRSHETKLPKRVRALGLKHALSSKVKANALVILDDAKAKTPKTAALRDAFGKLGWQSVLIIDGPEVDKNFELAARSIKDVDVLPFAGLNVYDILRRDTLVLTKAAVEQLEERFK